jgi:folate-binding protein YgfZ
MDRELWLAEYDRVRSAAGLFDTSDRGKLELFGPEAPNFLQNLSTNDVVNLPLGGGCEAFFLTPTAKIVDHALIYHTRMSDGQDALWLDVAPRRAPSLLSYLERYHIAENFEIADRTGEFAQFHLAGPDARSVLHRATGGELPDLEALQHMERTIANSAVCHIRRYDALALTGFDIVCLVERAGEVRAALIAAGAAPAGAECYNILRVEAGAPLIGIDMDESRFVLEVGRPDAICHTKGCYLGQEPIVMARDRAGHVNRSLRGLKLSADPSAPKTKLFSEAGQDVGVTASSARLCAPRLRSTGHQATIGCERRTGRRSRRIAVHLSSSSPKIATALNKMCMTIGPITLCVQIASQPSASARNASGMGVGHTLA